MDLLNKGNYKREEFRKAVLGYYEVSIKKNPQNERYREGWTTRTEMMLDVFFDGNYGDMLLDAVNGVKIE